VGSLQARREGVDAAARVPAVLAAMHLSWGIGLLVGALAGAVDGAADPTYEREVRR